MRKPQLREGLSLSASGVNGDEKKIFQKLLDAVKDPK